MDGWMEGGREGGREGFTMATVKHQTRDSCKRTFVQDCFFCIFLLKGQNIARITVLIKYVIFQLIDCYRLSQSLIFTGSSDFRNS